MTLFPRRLVLPLVCLAVRLAAADFDVKTFGATGDGRTLDSPAINRAIAAASALGGGTVRLPAGTYLSGSIHLASNLTLQLDAGATLLASPESAAYDLAEPNPLAEKFQYQDFGHSHFQNSLLWGDGLEDVFIAGPGRIDGTALAHGDHDETSATRPTGNKAIALKNCRRVTLRDLTILRGGWFAVLATGVDELTLDNLKIDTNRDGIDIDACQGVRISNCTVNSPNDDGICLKSSYALGSARPLKNVTIINCQVSGYDVGTLLDGTRLRTAAHLYKNSRGPHGRIKLGTESNGGFQNITISNCVFDYCRGLALESVDGALMEDIAISNITMRDIVNAPVFIRLGARLRGPEGTKVGAARRISITRLVASNVASDHGIFLTGVPGHAIEDVLLGDIFIGSAGGGTREQAARAVPEDEREYPEPWRFGPLPSYGLFARHVKNLSVHHVEFRPAAPDARFAILLADVDGATFDHLKFPATPITPGFWLKSVRRFSVLATPGVADTHFEEPALDAKL